MNKNDKTLILILIIICFIFMILINLNKKKGKLAQIFYDGNLILTVDLSNKEEQKYEVEGKNGIVKIISKNGKIKVDSENSPLHICSNMGYISSSFETITCLPNKIVIQIVDDGDIDTIVR